VGNQHKSRTNLLVRIWAGEGQDIT
jgi:hypothetical protein